MVRWCGLSTCQCVGREMHGKVGDALARRLTCDDELREAPFGSGRSMMIACAISPSFVSLSLADLNELATESNNLESSLG